MKQLFTLLLCLCLNSVFASGPRHQYVKITTAQGECIILLYNKTPLHRDNFVKLVKQGFYNGTLFHRVINSFMIQGGDPDSKNAPAGKELGNGDVNYTIPAEFRDSLFHQKGALAAARDDNPKMASSGCQFYLVQGKKLTDPQLDSMEVKRLHFKIPLWEREVYKTVGGTPHLDKKYTVYGQVISGLAMIDTIASVQKDANDRPLADIKMNVTLLKRRKARKLEKELRKSGGEQIAFLLNQ
ncbi:peptidylprolyl isomerase [Pedobacter cryoconitis]|uniref:peptidylprolyl isomerase n=1 Tax=Pedobacter cryoconitis TaxID=188932 RepID=A0A7X0J2K2_9SPHI|nr:peptidylprolyl isomerase [Pedobacter cryoconitis]MBB6499539.1 peptidyl-prolyl cis-trans isomerase B (cyclophilin B) [Pedobacter cryoconitis]